MDKKTKQILIITLSAVFLFALLINFNYVLPLLGKAITLIMPIICGAIIAIFINVPVSGYEKLLKKVFAKKEKPYSDTTYNSLAFLLTVISAAVIIFLVSTLIVPAVRSSAKNLYTLILSRIPSILDYLKSHNLDYSWIESMLSDINLQNMFKNFAQTAQSLLGGVATAITSTINVATTVVFSVIVAIYAILAKKKVAKHSIALIKAYVKPSFAEKITKFGTVFSATFSRFLSGQCIEALILGTLMFTVFAIFKLPYAILVGVLTAFCAIIPYVGAFISCTLITVLITIVNPLTGLKALALYLLVQFVENQFIYPRVVGGNVGLPPLYTLVAALIGGKLFGIVGILFFIPLVATFYILIKEDIKLKESPKIK